MKADTQLKIAVRALKNATVYVRATEYCDLLDDRKIGRDYYMPESYIL